MSLGLFGPNEHAHRYRNRDEDTTSPGLFGPNEHAHRYRDENATSPVLFGVDVQRTSNDEDPD